jgi:hypothetical protein
MELDLQGLFGLLGIAVGTHCHWLIPRNTPVPRIWAHIRGRYWSVKVDERISNLFVTTW